MADEQLGLLDYVAPPEQPRREAAKPEHSCHAVACERPCPPERLMCGRHWAMVPKPLQLVRDRPATVRMLDEVRRKTWGPAETRERFGVWPHSIPDWLALVGDKSDGYPGVPARAGLMC